MTRMLFIDDLRSPPSAEWHVARSSKEAIEYIKLNGIPDEISFDHDLGGDDTAMKVLKFIIDSVLDEELSMPKKFTFHVHSANPVGATNIRETLNGFLRFLGSDDERN